MRDTKHRLRSERSTSLLRDPTAEKHDLLRVIDESGDDYLYPKTFFNELSYRKQSGRR
jgi:hypothetical protein